MRPRALQRAARVCLFVLNHAAGNDAHSTLGAVSCATCNQVLDVCPSFELAKIFPARLLCSHCHLLPRREPHVDVLQGIDNEARKHKRQMMAMDQAGWSRFWTRFSSLSTTQRQVQRNESEGVHFHFSAAEKINV